MIRTGAVLIVFVLPMSSCGGGGTKTVTETRTVTVQSQEAAAGNAKSADPDEFCASAKGDALAQGAGESQAAVNDADVAAMERATTKLLAAAKNAPAGAPCAADALNTLVDNWNFGAGGNLQGVDIPAKVKRIRSFQQKRELR